MPAKHAKKSGSKARQGGRSGYTARHIISSTGMVGKTILTFKTSTSKKNQTTLRQKYPGGHKNIGIRYTSNAWEEPGVLRSGSQGQYDYRPPGQERINLIDNWYGFYDHGYVQLLRSRGRYCLYGPPQLTGFWQPLDLFTNAQVTQYLKMNQMGWQMVCLGESKSSGGNLKAPSVIDLAAFQSSSIEKHRKEDQATVQSSFMWGGWSLPFDGTRDPEFMQHRVDKISGHKDRRLRRGPSIYHAYWRRSHGH